MNVHAAHIGVCRVKARGGRCLAGFLTSNRKCYIRRKTYHICCNALHILIATCLTVKWHQSDICGMQDGNNHHGRTGTNDQWGFGPNAMILRAACLYVCVSTYHPQSGRTIMGFGRVTFKGGGGIFWFESFQTWAKIACPAFNLSCVKSFSEYCYLKNPSFTSLILSSFSTHIIIDCTCL